MAFVLVKRAGDAADDVAGWGAPRPVGCGASYWPAANRCGVDGAGFAFRCPANCFSYLALNPRAVGDHEVVYRPLVGGGPPDADAAVYRGDSYLCAAAIHAGLVSNGHGGCGVIALAGRHQGFVASRRNGVASVAFDSYFLLSYHFVPGVTCASADPRWALLAISLAFTVLASLLTVRPALFFFPAFVVVPVAVVAAQAYSLRNEGRLPRLLSLYALLLAAIVVALALPAQNLRLRHYVVALLLLPGTGLQTRPSLLYQGLLVGLFINGVARWGFDPVLQTSLALQGDAHKGSLLPAVRPPAVRLGDLRSTITFAWDAPPHDAPYDGLSVLVNDAERFRTYFGDADHEDRFVWSRNRSLGLPEYFCFAFMSGSDSGDYTRAGTWTGDGRWLHMAPGPSKLRLARRA